LARLKPTIALAVAIFVTALLSALPDAAFAIVGDAELAAQRVAQHIVLVRSHRSVCSGTVLATDLVLTAAHCVREGEKLQVRSHGRRTLYPVRETASHPQFDRARTAVPTRVDLALLKLASPLPDRMRPALLGRRPTTAGEAVLVAGFGRHDPDAPGISGDARMAILVTLERRLGTQILLRDPTTLQESARLGACGGDSGGPAFAVRDGLVVIGVVTAVPGSCGGLTIVTPIAIHYDWIVETARKLGSAVDH
jgi:S1-C subfamily serine protease